MKKILLSEDKIEVLNFFGEKPDWCFAFEPVCRELSMGRNDVRRICRYLAKHNLLKFQRGLFTDEGDVAGAGYGITPEGLSHLEELKGK